MNGNLLLAACTLGLLTNSACAAVLSLVWDVGHGSVPGTTTTLYAVKLSVKFTDPGDRVTGVSASEFISISPFYQHALGGDTEPHSALVAIAPELAFDTFVTVGKATTSRGPSATLTPGAGFGPSSFLGGWSATSQGTHTLAGDDLKVLLAQITYASQPPSAAKASVSLVLNWRDAGGSAHSTYLESRCMGVLTPILCPTLTSEIDSNDDCVVNGLDLAIFLGQWGVPCPSVFVAECAGDFNNDLSVNGLDLAILLGAWGPVPVCPPS